MKLLIIGIALLFSFGTSSAQSSCQCPNNENTIKVGTWNVGLSIYDPYKDARRAQLEMLLAGETLDLDILCSQEIYAERDFLSIEDSLGSEYSVFRPPRLNLNCSRACTEPEWTAIESCLRNNECYSAETIDSAETCAFVNCRDEITSVPRGCQSCISQARDGESLESRVAQCRGFDASESQYWEDCLFVQDGATDGTIFTKYDISESDYRYLNSSFILKTVSYARLTGIGENNGVVNFFCTHLSAYQPELIDANWETVNREQIDQLLGFVNLKTSQHPDEFIIIAGDFNTGPQVGNLEDQWPENYNAILQGGYQNAYLLSLASESDAQCDFCASNPLNQLFNFTSNQLGSHIFVKAPFEGCVSDGDTFGTENNVQVDNTLISMSDHYGIYVSLCPFEGADTQFTRTTVVTVSTDTVETTLTGVTVDTVDTDTVETTIPPVPTTEDPEENSATSLTFITTMSIFCAFMAGFIY